MSYSNKQLTLLVTLRVLIGWHFLYEGVSKFIAPNWSSIGYLLDSKGFMSDIFHSMATNTELLKIIDILNVYGLIAIGLGLILGLMVRPALYGGILLLTFYYLSHPPMIGMNYAMPSEGSYLWVNKNLIEIAAMALLLVFPTSRIIGIDRFIFKSEK